MRRRNKRACLSNPQIGETGRPLPPNEPSQQFHETPWLVVVSVTLLFVLATTSIVADILFNVNYVGPDFTSFYYACRAASLGADFYDVGVLRRLADQDGLAGVLPFLYPPVFPYLFMELARLQVSTAQLVWSLAGIAAFCGATVMAVVGIRRRQILLGIVPVSWPLAMSLGLGLALGLNLPCSVVMGQVNLFVLLLVLPILIFPEESRHWASALMALAILIKVTPIFLLLVFLAARRYRSVGRSCLWMGVWVACSLVRGAWTSWIAFFRFLPETSYGQAVPGLFRASALSNFSVAGFFSRLTDSPNSTFVLTCLTMALLAVPVLYRARNCHGIDNAGVMLSAYILVLIGSPLTYLHHVIMVLPMLLWFSATYLSSGSTKTTAGLALGIIAGTDFPVLYGRLGASPTTSVASSLNLYALLGLYALGLMRAQREPAPGIG